MTWPPDVLVLRDRTASNSGGQLTLRDATTLRGRRLKERGPEFKQLLLVPILVAVRLDWKLGQHAHCPGVENRRLWVDILPRQTKLPVDWRRMWADRLRNLHN
jgi:hypothetical protein